MTWHEAQERFGSDKPDVRFGMELVELTDVFAETGFNAFKAPCVKGIRVPGGADRRPATSSTTLTDQAKRWGAKGLVWMRVDRPTGARLAGRQVPDRVGAGRSRHHARGRGGRPPAARRRRPGRRSATCSACSASSSAARRCTEGGFNYLWVVDFPLFESLDDEGRPIPAHHPFTMPHPDDHALLDSAEGEALLDIRAQAYDLVLNGWELGSGSVRIHRSDIQPRIFELLGISAEEAQPKFGFLLDAFRFGAPPHAGFAFGIDRLVALLAGEENIREVIAFPKTQSGTDPLTSAPTPIDPAQLTELGLRLLPKPT